MDLTQAAAEIPAPPRMLLHAVNWDEYEKFSEAMGKRPHRLTYDGSNLEIAASSYLLQVLKRRLAFALVFVSAAFDVELRGCGSTTLKRKAVGCGIDPDEGFYVGEHGRHMGWPYDFDLDRDPPPDIVIDLEIYPSELDRASVFATLKVPELWVVKGSGLPVHRLEDGRYIEVAHSNFFPRFQPELLLDFVLKTWDQPDNRLIAVGQSWALGLVPE